MQPIDVRYGEPLVRFHLLGTPAIECQGRPFTLPRRQARALLFRLAAANQPVPREELADLLWPDNPPAAARRNLTRLLSYLRGQLPQAEILQVSRTAVSLHPTLTTSDSRQFARHYQSKQPTDWETAVSLYRGSFLNGFALNDNPVFDNWLSQEQRQWEQRYLETLRRLVQATSQPPGKAIDYARRYLATDDLDEEMHRRLIELYARTGERSAALRQFEQCLLVLERELGVAPLPETRAAYEAARDGRPLTALPKAPEPEWATLPGLDLPLIGREAAWEKLESAHGRFQSGGVIFISGEPGVGKSRLMQDFATAQASLILTGHNPVGGQTAPYEPLVQALRLALPLQERWRHAQSIWLAEAARLLPELTVHFPDLPAAVEVEPDQAQARLFEALTQVFRSLATDSPLLLCLDDVHWADEATAGWLHYVTKRLKSSQICIVATYRSPEAAALHDWRQALARANLMTDVALTGLSGTAVSELLRQLPEKSAELAKFATQIHLATGGNAFFVLETIRALLSDKPRIKTPAALPLPPTVRAAVLRRVERLNPLARQVLEVTAVLTPFATLETIAETAGRDELETATSLEALSKRQMLRPEQDQFHFQHDLARETIYQEISPWRKRLLHRRAARALLNMPEANAALAAIAIHFASAGDELAAIDYYRQAATAAAAIYAYQAARDHLEQALVLALAAPDAVALLPELYEALGDNLAILGNFAEAEAAYRKLLTTIQADEVLHKAAVVEKLAGTLPPQQKSVEAEQLYRQALKWLESETARTDAAWSSVKLNLLLGLLDALYFQFRPEAMADLQVETEALLEAVGTVAQQVSYYSRLGQLAFLQKRFRAPIDNIPRAGRILALARGSGNRRLIGRQTFHYGFHLLWAGKLTEAERHLQQALATADDLGDSWLHVQSLVYLSIECRLTGDTDRLRRYMPALAAQSEEVGHTMYIAVELAQRAWLHYRAGEWPQARTLAQAALATWANAPYPFQWLAHWLLLALALRQHQLAEAIEASRAMLDAKQQKLADEIDDLLQTAVSAWEANDAEDTQKALETAVARATDHGYL